MSTSAGPGPCIANANVVQIIIDKCRKYFGENPTADTISLGMTDGGWCECEACKAMDGPSIEINEDTSPRSQRYYMIQKGDKSKFLGGVEVKAATEIARKVVVDLAWPEVYRQLKAGKREPEKLVAAARKAIASAAPPQLEDDPVANARIDALLKMASRIAVASRTASPPTIDGDPSEALWQWTDHHPWFAWKSGVQVPHHTRFARGVRCAGVGSLPSALVPCHTWGAATAHPRKALWFGGSDPKPIHIAPSVRVWRAW